MRIHGSGEPVREQVIWFDQLGCLDVESSLSGRKSK